MTFEKEGGALVCRHAGETLRIEPWGKEHGYCYGK